MSRHSQRASDEDLARIRRRMRFEDLSGLPLIIAMTLGAVAVVVLPSRTLVPVVIVTVVVTFVAIISYAVGYIRTERAFARVQTEPKPRAPRRVYVVAIVAALITALAFLLFPQYSRLLWYAYVVITSVGFVWTSVTLIGAWRKRNPPRSRPPRLKQAATSKE